MAIIFESTLVGYPYTNNNPGIRLGQQIKGSLTSVTDTSDYYNLIINEMKLVNLKFYVEQAVTEYDFYTIRTPVGIFKIDFNVKFPFISVKKVSKLNTKGSIFLTKEISVKILSKNLFIRSPSIFKGISSLQPVNCV